ncbi:MAG: fibrobacter succinogenes major paralogous domain-containing protein [Tannerellaceae bacterium]|jgi:hypothetical protein|nr:fibrobacter succinogenes major paralogous domain-containing protein [Tannerellaceae bacterium]
MDAIFKLIPAIAAVMLFVSLSLIIIILVTRYELRRKEAKSGPVYVLINGKPVWLDLENLKDDELAKRDYEGNYESGNGEHHFTFDHAQLAAKKQGKWPLTREECEFIACLPRGWDDDKKGMWFTFDRVEGGTVDVFFPAAGYRLTTSGAFYGTGSVGQPWSSAVTGANGFRMAFSSTSVNPTDDNNLAYGFSVRCVRDLQDN